MYYLGTTTTSAFQVECPFKFHEQKFLKNTSSPIGNSKNAAFLLFS